MVNYKAVTPAGIAIIALATFLGYELTTDSYYCEDEPAKLLECTWGLSNGLGSRCYLNPLKKSWDYCKTGWLRAYDNIEEIQIKPIMDCVNKTRITYHMGVVNGTFNCSGGNIITFNNYSICRRYNGTLEKIDNAFVYPVDYVVSTENNIMTYQYIGSVQRNVTYEVCTRTGVYEIGNKTFNFRDNWQCSFELNNTCVVCDSTKDGNGDGICHSGESCIKWCRTSQGLTKYEKNSRDDFVKVDNSFRRTKEVPQ